MEVPCRTLMKRLSLSPELDTPPKMLGSLRYIKTVSIVETASVLLFPQTEKVSPPFLSCATIVHESECQVDTHPAEEERRPSLLLLSHPPILLFRHPSLNLLPFPSTLYVSRPPPPLPPRLSRAPLPPHPPCCSLQKPLGTILGESGEA